MFTVVVTRDINSLLFVLLLHKILGLMTDIIFDELM